MIKLKPLPSNVPPVDASYQSMVVPAAHEADKLTVPEPQREPFSAFMGTSGPGSTVIETIVVLVQLPAVAVMVNVVICCVFVLFVNVPVIEFPVPLVAIPVRLDVLVLVQLNVVPARLFGLLILICVIAVPEQIV